MLKLFPNNTNYSIASKESQGWFGAKRTFDIHTGIDIYVPVDTKVLSLYDGTVVNIEWFTGEYSEPPTPWWYNTMAVWVKSDYLDETIVYGEIEPSVDLGQKILKGMVVGTVKEVLKKNKDKNPTSMLHIELYKNIPKQTVVWKLNEEKPENLLNPEGLLKI